MTQPTATPTATPPAIGMLVTFIRRDHDGIPYGATGVIDAVNGERFWVLVDGGFFGWTTFESWKWTGQLLPRNAETEAWYSTRESLAGSYGDGDRS